MRQAQSATTAAKTLLAQKGETDQNSKNEDTKEVCDLNILTHPNYHLLNCLHSLGLI